jgi:hypothetical protein
LHIINLFTRFTSSRTFSATTCIPSSLHLIINWVNRTFTVYVVTNCKGVYHFLNYITIDSSLYMLPTVAWWTLHVRTSLISCYPETVFCLAVFLWWLCWRFQSSGIWWWLWWWCVIVWVVSDFWPWHWRHQILLNTGNYSPNNTACCAVAFFVCDCSNFVLPNFQSLCFC